MTNYFVPHTAYLFRAGIGLLTLSALAVT